MLCTTADNLQCEIISEFFADLLLFVNLLTEDEEIVQRFSTQNDMYSKLRAKNIMDEVSYTEQTAELKKRISTLRNRRVRLMSEDEDIHYIDDLRFLKEILQNSPPAIISLDEDLFTSIVERIRARDDGTIIFELKGGLKFKERIGVAA